MHYSYLRSHRLVKTIFLVAILCITSGGQVFSTESVQPPQPNLDEMFIQAQDLAFDQQGAAARALCLQILDINADYHDASILIARTNAWEESYDQATLILEGVLAKDAGNNQALSAMADVQIWAGNYSGAIEYLDRALENQPENIDLLYKKAQALNFLEDYTPAIVLLNQVLDIDPSHAGAKDLLASIENNKKVNFIGAGYRGDYFDNHSPWHLYFLEYGRNTKALGTIIARVNYAQRFNQSGFQFEADAYPILAPGTYLYLNAGYSPDDHVFPRYRAGFEIFQQLPSAFEASLGFRLLTYSQNDLLILTGSISKYIPNYYFSFRPYITIASIGPGSQSYFLTARRYFSSVHHHLSLTIGTGFSADEDALIGGELYNLESNKVLLQYQQKLSPAFLIKTGAGYQHYSEGVYGNKYSVELGIVYLF